MKGQTCFDQRCRKKKSEFVVAIYAVKKLNACTSNVLINLNYNFPKIYLQPQPLTEPSELNFHLSSSPLTRNSGDQSVHSLPDLILTIRPVPSMIVRGSCLLSVEHCRSNSIRKDSAPKM